MGTKHWFRRRGIWRCILELLNLKSVNKIFWVLITIPILIQGQLSQQELQSLTPHEMPANHPVRLRLDKLFQKSRFIRNVESLEKAGFDYAGPRKHTGLIVATHLKTPGYIYKIYTDVQEFYKGVPEYQLWLMRIEGVRRINEYVQQHNLNHLFKAPQKWIYIIPESAPKADNYYPKFTILVEERMDILSDKKNLDMWKGKGISKPFLNELYQLITQLGLRDCAKPDNIPFCKDRRVAFIDTQTFDENPVSYYRLTRNLNADNRKYWIQLTNDGR